MTNLNKSPLHDMGVIIIIRGYRTSETAARVPVKSPNETWFKMWEHTVLIFMFNILPFFHVVDTVTKMNS